MKDAGDAGKRQAETTFLSSSFPTTLHNQNNNTPCRGRRGQKAREASAVGVLAGFLFFMSMVLALLVMMMSFGESG